MSPVMVTLSITGLLRAEAAADGVKAREIFRRKWTPGFE